jgi:deoxyribonucleoside regulator
MMEDSSFKETISLFDRVTIAISGIGALSSSVDSLYLTAGYLQKEDLIKLRESKAVGDVFGHFFNVRGELCNPELEMRTIGIEPQQLKKVGCSIAVAGGNHKSLAILGALRGQVINTLVTNLSTAIDILEKDLILSR